MRLQEDIGGNAESRSSSCLLPNWCHFSFCEVQVLLLILIWVNSDTFAVVVKGSSDICSDVRQFGVNNLNSQCRMDVIMTNWKYLFAYQGIILNLSAGKIVRFIRIGISLHCSTEEELESSCVETCLSLVASQQLKSSF